MPDKKATLYNMDGAPVGEIELNEYVFGASVNKNVLHDAVVNYLANQRQGTSSTKTRSEVRGGGKKPWRQKGTGRARQGSTRSPQWIKGGVALGPKPRDYSYKLNKKVKAIAMRSALSDKVNNNAIMVIDDLTVSEIKTRTIADMLKKLGANKKSLIVTDGVNKNVYFSARNIEGVTASYVGMLNVYEVLNHDTCIISRDGISKLTEVYGNE